MRGCHCTGQYPLPGPFATVIRVPRGPLRSCHSGEGICIEQPIELGCAPVLPVLAVPCSFEQCSSNFNTGPPPSYLFGLYSTLQSCLLGLAHNTTQWRAAKAWGFHALSPQRSPRLSRCMPHLCERLPVVSDSHGRHCAEMWLARHRKSRASMYMCRLVVLHDGARKVLYCTVHAVCCRSYVRISHAASSTHDGRGAVGVGWEHSWLESERLEAGTGAFFTSSCIFVPLSVLSQSRSLLGKSLKSQCLLADQACIRFAGLKTQVAD